MSTIAEDVLLVMNTHVKTGVFVAPDELTEILVGGCLVAEALLAGSVRLDDGRRFSRGAHAITAEVDPLVERAARHVVALEPDPDAEFDDERWIAAVTFPLRAAGDVTDGLRARDALRIEEHKKFGRKPAMIDVTEPDALTAVADRLRAVMLDGETPDPPTSVALLILAVCGGAPNLSRPEGKRWAQRADALFTWMYWKGDEGTPSEPVSGIDDPTRRMLGDFVVSLGTAYQMGVASEISNALKYSRPS